LEYLLDSAEKEYGTGTELPSTGYLIFGLLTFWVYTVWNYYKHILRHFTLRVSHFDGLYKALQVPDDMHTVRDTIITKGFTIGYLPRNVAIVCYLVSMLLMLSLIPLEIMLSKGILTENVFDRSALIMVGVAAFAFSGADVFFLSWVCNTLKRHEYHELLYARLVNSPDTYTVGQPSRKFIQRWTNKQNQIALFIILSIPMTISPLMAVWHVQQLIYSGGNFAQAIVIWSVPGGCE